MPRSNWKALVMRGILPEALSNVTVHLSILQCNHNGELSLEELMIAMSILDPSDLKEDLLVCTAHACKQHPSGARRCVRRVCSKILPEVVLPPRGFPQGDKIRKMETCVPDTQESNAVPNHGLARTRT